MLARTHKRFARLAEHCSPLEFYEQFESQLPPEVRVELGDLPVSGKTSVDPRNRRGDPRGYRMAQKPRLSAAYHSRTFAGSATASTADTASRVPAGRGMTGLVWALIISCILAPIVLIGMLANLNNSHPASFTASLGPSHRLAFTGSQPVEVRRALPVDVRRAVPIVPRAELATSSRALLASSLDPQTGQ